MMVNRLCGASLALALITGSAGTAMADGDAEAGRQKSQVCQACHGEVGISVDPTYPHLAGQYADYLEYSLKRYRSGERQNVLMSPMAANLTDQDIEDLAAWYSSQDGLRSVSGR